MADKSVAVWGVVAADSSILTGAGYTVDHVKEGVYNVMFDEAFNVAPSVIVTQMHPSGLDMESSQFLDNAVVIIIGNDRFRLVTGADDGGAQDRDFSFIAMGN